MAEIACKIGDRIRAVTTRGRQITGRVDSVLGGGPGLPRIVLLVIPDGEAETQRVEPAGVVEVVP